VDDVVFRTKRKPQLFVGAFGIAMLIVGALASGGARWFAFALGAIGVVSGLTALFPSLGYVRFSPEGLTVKYVVLPARTVAWRDVAGVTSEGVRQIRHTVPSLVVAYVPGYDGPRVGQRLDETRSYVGNFTTASGDELAAQAREFLARYRG
jgi:hypothetical protein